MTHELFRSRSVVMHPARSLRDKVSSLVNKLGHAYYLKPFRKLAFAGNGIKTPKVRRGCVPMYVGEEAKRYEVPLKYLSLPVFHELLKTSQGDDLEAKLEGPITISCSTQMFDYVLKKVEKY